MSRLCYWWCYGYIRQPIRRLIERMRPIDYEKNATAQELAEGLIREARAEADAELEYHVTKLIDLKESEHRCANCGSSNIISEMITGAKAPLKELLR